MSEAALQYFVVGFLDILGFSTMVEKDSNSTMPCYLPSFVSVFEQIARGKEGKGLTVRMFSDSIVIEAPLTPCNVMAVMDAAAELQRLFLQHGILLRGGIAFGKHFVNANVTFSQALISAYNVESKIARFPRVVIDENTLNYAWHDQSVDDLFRGQLKLKILVDRDGKKFIDYLTEETLADLTPKVHECIKANSPTKETVFEKIQWLLDYYNYRASAFNLKPLDVAHFTNGFSKLLEIS